MNGEWWGGSLRSPPAEYTSALRPGFAASKGLFAQRSSAGALTFYTATETVARPGGASGYLRRLWMHFS